MLSDSLLAVADLLLPEVLIEYFDLTRHEFKGEELHFYFTENNSVPLEFSTQKLSSKGFSPEATFRDFPLQGKPVYLHITRRRWINETTDKVVTRESALVVKGTRINSPLFMRLMVKNYKDSIKII